MVHSQGDISVLFDGSLYNGHELALELGLPSATADIELACGAFERWGEALLPRLRGEFALVVAHRQAGTVVAARDPTGARPLYYARVDNSFLFSTAIDALLEEPDVSANVDAVELADFVWQRLPPLEPTCFAALRRVPPGHKARIQGSSVCVSRYWLPDGRSNERLMLDSALDEFSCLIEQAAERATRPGRAAILLSGGIDSATVAAATAASSAREKARSAPLAVSLVAPADPYPEHVQQRHFAHALALDHVTVAFDELIHTDSVRFGGLEWSERMSRPIADPFMPVHVELLRTAIARGCPVVLTGYGGDEWFGISSYIAADCIRRLDLVRLYTFWRARSDWLGGGALKSTVWTAGVRPIVRPLRRHRAVNLPRWLAPDAAVAAALRDREEERSRNRPRTEPLARRATLDDPLTALLQELHFEERSLIGAEVRAPILDADLVAFLYRAPPDLLLVGRRIKGLPRAYLDTRLGEAGLPPLRRVAAPGLWETFIEREAAPLAGRVGDLRALEEAGIVSRRLPSLSNDWASLLTEVGANAFWHLLSAEAWLRRRL